MAEPGREELHNLVVQLRHFLAYQQRLGLAALPPGPRKEREHPANAAPEISPTVAGVVLTLEAVRAELGDCQRCKLSRTRRHLVFGAGDSQARLVFIGEGPGEEEDLQGVPFVGPAGQLLDRLFDRLELERQEVYITNIVKCRPPGNRNPEADEISACLPFLKKQLQAIQPRIICTLGRIATQVLLETPAPLSRIRGQWQKWQDIQVMPTFHPSYLLRFPAERKKTWEDMQKVMSRYRAKHHVA
ncbi:MAG: uracil-DNA glycosylase [Desulfobacca sp.]|nr:uracil-DNA glycosylase [Desulfobacca sp.]